MDNELKKLQKNIINIKNIVENINKTFDKINSIKSKMENMYADMLKNNNKQLFLFGLDSFHFQNRLIDIETEEMKKIFNVINNRMYCEYYKLYKLIVEYIKTNISNKKLLELTNIINNFPVYKDLEPYKYYDFEIIYDVHENIITLMYEIYAYIINKDFELEQYQEKQNKGLNINNFVSLLKFNILMTKEKISLFISYLHFFHNLHTTHLNNFYNKVIIMYNQSLNTINLDDNNFKRITNNSEKWGLSVKPKMKLKIIRHVKKNGCINRQHKIKNANNDNNANDTNTQCEIENSTITNNNISYNLLDIDLLGDNTLTKTSSDELNGVNVTKLVSIYEKK